MADDALLKLCTGPQISPTEVAEAAERYIACEVTPQQVEAALADGGDA